MRTARAVGHVLIVVGLGLMAAGVAAGQTRTVPDAGLDQRLKTFENALAVDPENLQLAAQYRQATVAAGLFDRAIDFFAKQAGRKGGGPDVQISLALAYVDKVPTAGDIRRLYLGRDAMSALTRSIAKRPCVLAYYMRGLINLYYNRFIFRRTDNGVADLTQALSMVTESTPPALVARVYAALGDGYFRLDNLAQARDTWSAGASMFPDDAEFQIRLEKQGEALAAVVGTALSAGRRVDTSLTGMLPIS